MNSRGKKINISLDHLYISDEASVDLTRDNPTKANDIVSAISNNDLRGLNILITELNVKNPIIRSRIKHHIIGSPTDKRGLGSESSYISSTPEKIHVSTFIRGASSL